jgi:predicted Zn-dependent protease
MLAMSMGGMECDLTGKLMRSLRKWIGVLVGVAVIAAPAGAAWAQGKQKLALIRDAEIEALLKDYTAPLFKAANLGAGAVEVLIVNDPRFNAFVTGRRMFVNTGALVVSRTPNEIIGVIAHETGHIIGGHQMRLRDRVEKANVLAALSMIAGAGVALAGGEAGGAAGAAIAAGGQSAALRELLAYKRSEEAAADAAAVALLSKTGQSARGMLKTFERFQQEVLFSKSRVDPYLQTHPMPRERFTMVESLGKAEPYFDTADPAALQLRHDMARAKIVAYSGNGGDLQSVFRDNPQGPAARYGLAIALHLRGSDREALPMIDRLIQEVPDHAYLHEMRGEILLRAGDARNALAAFRKAIALDRHKSGLVRANLGLAMLETRDPALIDAAIGEIKGGLVRDPDNSRGYGMLARAYAAKGEETLARAYAAEEAFHAGALGDAIRLAKLAQPKLKNGSPEWLRMQDILDYKPPKKS